MKEEVDMRVEQFFTVYGNWCSFDLHVFPLVLKPERNFYFSSPIHLLTSNVETKYINEEIRKTEQNKTKISQLVWGQVYLTIYGYWL